MEPYAMAPSRPSCPQAPLGILAVEHADEYAVGVSDQDRADFPFLHPLDERLQVIVWTERCGALLHHLFDPHVWVHIPDVTAQTAEHLMPVVHDDADLPPGSLRPCMDFTHSVTGP